MRTMTAPGHREEKAMPTAREERNGERASTLAKTEHNNKEVQRI